MFSGSWNPKQVSNAPVLFLDTVSVHFTFSHPVYLG